MDTGVTELLERPTPPVGGGRSTARRRLAAVLAVLLPTVATFVHALAYGRWIVDDAGITFAYARSITSGAGPVLQPGAVPVEGYSNPAWMGVMSAGRAIGLFDHGAWFGVPDYVLFPKGVALLCCAGVFLAGYLAATAVSRRPALVAGAAGLVTAATPSFVIWSFSGLENSLLAVAVVGLAAVLVRAAANGRLATVGTAVWCGLLAALAALTRPDAVLYAAAYPVVALLLVTRPTVRRTLWSVPLSIGVFAVPFGGYLAWRHSEFGQLLPNTAIAKAQSVPTVSSLAKATDLVAYVGWPLVVVAVVCVGAALARASRARTGLVALLVPLGLAVLSFAVLIPDWMAQFRFATPVWPLAALATAIAAGEVLPQLATRGRAVVVVLTAAACAFTGISWSQDIQVFRTGPTLPMCLVVLQSQEYNGIARMLGVHNGSVLLPDVGGTALTSDLRVIDVAGLADGRIARYYADHDMAALRDYVLNDARPTIIAVHASWASVTGLLRDPRTTRDYDLLTDNRAEGSVLVRRDVIPNPTVRGQLSAYAVRSVGQQETFGGTERRASCGATLRPGT